MNLIKLTLLGAMLVLLLTIFGVKLAESPESAIITELCLTQCASKEGCRGCWEVFIDSENYDLYERRIDELMWKYEAW